MVFLLGAPIKPPGARRNVPAPSSWAWVSGCWALRVVWGGPSPRDAVGRLPSLCEMCSSSSTLHNTSTVSPKPSLELNCGLAVTRAEVPCWLHGGCAHWLWGKTSSVLVLLPCFFLPVSACLPCWHSRSRCFAGGVFLQFVATEIVRLGNLCLCYLEWQYDEAWEVHWKLAICSEAQEPPPHAGNWRAHLHAA